MARSNFHQLWDAAQLSTYKRLPDAYYKHVYINKKMYQGVEIIARIERTSIKEATDLLLASAISQYMGEKLLEHIKNEKEIKELNLQRHPYPPRFVREVRKLCKERSIDNRKII